MAALFVVALLVMWWIASVCGQFDRPARLIRRFDPCSLVPRWTFFAPNPGRTDFHLLYRERGADGITGGWTEIYPVSTRTWWTALWNPNKRRRKAVVDLAQTLQIVATRDPTRSSVVLSVPYLAFLNLIAGLDPRGSVGRSREFVIVETDGPVRDSAPRVVLRSEPHAVADVG